MTFWALRRKWEGEDRECFEHFLDVSVLASSDEITLENILPKYISQEFVEVILFFIREIVQLTNISPHFHRPREVMVSWKPPSSRRCDCLGAKN